MFVERLADFVPQTLELRVDNLQMDFLYKHIQSVQGELMQALWPTIGALNDQRVQVAFRLLAIFGGGGGNPKTMVEPQRLLRQRFGSVHLQ